MTTTIDNIKYSKQRQGNLMFDLLQWFACAVGFEMPAVQVCRWLHAVRLCRYGMYNSACMRYSCIGLINPLSRPSNCSDDPIEDHE